MVFVEMLMGKGAATAGLSLVKELWGLLILVIWPPNLQGHN